MKAIKTVVTLQSINNTTIKKPMYEFYTLKEPTKRKIKEKIQKQLHITLETKKISPDKGGDFGAFFYYNDMYITYHFEDIEIDTN